MIPKSYNEWIDSEPISAAIEVFKRHNAQLAMKRLEVHDPVKRETVRQRQIIDAALVSLASGDTQQARQLLGEL